jgi:hypothetical protein
MVMASRTGLAIIRADALRQEGAHPALCSRDKSWIGDGGKEYRGNLQGQRVS